MYGLPVTPSKSRLRSKTYLVNLIVGALSVAELKLGLIQPLLPVNFFLLVSFLLPVVNFILRENTERAVGLDDAGISQSNRVATIVLALFALALLAALLVWPPVAKAAERDYQLAWCTAHQGQAEVALPDKARVDCVTATHAVEVDFAAKWAEAIGQALYYAAATGKRAGIALIVGPDDGRYMARLHTAIRAQCLPIDVWEIVR